MPLGVHAVVRQRVPIVTEVLVYFGGLCTAQVSEAHPCVAGMQHSGGPSVSMQLSFHCSGQQGRGGTRGAAEHPLCLLSSAAQSIHALQDRILGLCLFSHHFKAEIRSYNVMTAGMALIPAAWWEQPQPRC